MRADIYTDGSYSLTHSVGAAVGIVLVGNEVSSWVGTYEHAKDHHFMELLAIYNTIDKVPKHVTRLVVHTDCQIALQALSSHYKVQHYVLRGTYGNFLVALKHKINKRFAQFSVTKVEKKTPDRIHCVADLLANRNLQKMIRRKEAGRDRSTTAEVVSEGKVSV